MNRYRMQCPVCHTWNRGLYLKETKGWMECIHCGTVVQAVDADGKRVNPPVDKDYGEPAMNNPQKITAGGGIASA